MREKVAQGHMCVLGAEIERGSARGRKSQERLAPVLKIGNMLEENEKSKNNKHPKEQQTKPQHAPNVQPPAPKY